MEVVDEGEEGQGDREWRVSLVVQVQWVDEFGMGLRGGFDLEGGMEVG